MSVEAQCFEYHGYSYPCYNFSFSPRLEEKTKPKKKYKNKKKYNSTWSHEQVDQFLNMYLDKYLKIIIREKNSLFLQRKLSDEIENFSQKLKSYMFHEIVKHMTNYQRKKLFISVDSKEKFDFIILDTEIYEVLKYLKSDLL